MKFLFTLALSALNVNAYWLMGIGSSFLLQGIVVLSQSILEDFITTERIDPVVSKNKVAVSAHVHSSMFCSFIFLSFLKKMIIELFSCSFWRQQFQIQYDYG